ncbi:helix-turn-helix domain-containing protein [Robertmurraya massiliosenegalensis]|uniref:helix-turn-helix domain-containing protein n=1 Tax=Robertmurraya TaxID=2837507 RepID=UPI0039A6F190
MDSGKYLTVKEFAEKTGKSEETIKRYLRKGIYPDAYKANDKAGWRIPEMYLFPEKDLSKQLQLDFNAQVPSSNSTSENDEHIISLAYQIAFLAVPSDNILKRLKLCGVVRALEIILTMRQSPKPIKNAEGFIRKAIMMGWSPNGLHKNIPKFKQKSLEEKTTEQVSPSAIPFYNWLEDN